MDVLAQRADQAIDRVREAWRTQRQQLQVLGGALLLLLVIVVWDSYQWTQPPRSDLLQNLPETQLEYSLKTGQLAAASECWSCATRDAYVLRQQQLLTQLNIQTETLCWLASHSESSSGMSPCSTHGLLCTCTVVLPQSSAASYL